MFSYELSNNADTRMLQRDNYLQTKTKGHRLRADVRDIIYIYRYQSGQLQISITENIDFMCIRKVGPEMKKLSKEQKRNLRLWKKICVKVNRMLR